MAKVLPMGSFAISNGPSKFEFMVSLFDSKIVKLTLDIPLPATGGLRLLPKLDVIFQVAGKEDGGCEKWMGIVSFIDQNYEMVRRKFYYDCKTRTGSIKEWDDDTSRWH